MNIFQKFNLCECYIFVFSTSENEALILAIFQEFKKFLKLQSIANIFVFFLNFMSNNPPFIAILEEVNPPFIKEVGSNYNIFSKLM